MKDNKLYSMLFEEISKMPVIDTHEHLAWNEADRYNDKSDVLGEYLIHYLKSDIISAGLKQEDLQKVINPETDIMERWNIVEPFWEVCRYTGYGRALDIAAKDIYGIDRVNRNTIEELNKAFLEQKKPGHYKRVLKNLCNIETSLLDCWFLPEESDSELFKLMWQPQKFIIPESINGKDIFSYIEEKYGVRVKNLDDWMEALKAELDFVLKKYNVRTIKSAIAYWRTLKFDKVEYNEAKSLFVQSMNKCGNNSSQLEFPKELQDFMMHYFLNLANERNLTLQIHTGLLEGNGNTLANSDPSLLNNLFLEYPDVDFDLFHISYPYQGIACALAKMFPNVTIDMCWAHIISPAACVAALDDFLDAVPYNKISAFGGDYVFVDGVFGHLYISRQNVSRVLAKKVEEGVFDEGKALEIAKALYYVNPKRIFKL